MTFSDVLREVVRCLEQAPTMSVTIERGARQALARDARTVRDRGYVVIHQMRLSRSPEPGLEGHVACEVREVRSWGGSDWTGWRQISPPRFELIDVLATDWRIV